MELKILQIQELLKRNLFVSGEKKKMVLTKLNAGVDDVIIEKLYTFLQKTDHVQTELLQKVIQKDPKFLSNVQHAISGKKCEQLKNTESADRAKEANELNVLEAEFNNIFS